MTNADRMPLVCGADRGSDLAAGAITALSLRRVAACHEHSCLPAACGLKGGKTNGLNAFQPSRGSN